MLFPRLQLPACTSFHDSEDVFALKEGIGCIAVLIKQVEEDEEEYVGAYHFHHKVEAILKNSVCASLQAAG